VHSRLLVELGAEAGVAADHAQDDAQRSQEQRPERHVVSVPVRIAVSPAISAATAVTVATCTTMAAVFGNRSAIWNPRATMAPVMSPPTCARVSMMGLVKPGNRFTTMSPTMGPVSTRRARA